MGPFVVLLSRKKRLRSCQLQSQPMYTQQELDAKLLAAANALRGPIDPADFKAYIFPLLFLKHISDTWNWEYQRALEIFDGDKDLALLPDNYRFIVPQAPDGNRDASTPKGCAWEDLLALEENVGAGLQLIFDRLQEANPETLAGVFGAAQWANKAILPEERLTSVVDVFTSLKLDPESVTHDLLGNAYEYLLKYFADGSGTKAGEFFTPRAVVRLMVRMLEPEAGESIYDPTCGSGGMLVESVNTVRAHGQDPRELRLFGQEVSATTAGIARMNLYIHDIETFEVKRGDTLRDPRLRKPDGSLQQFDVVIANPPFSIGRETPWGHEAWAHDPFGRAAFGVPPRSFADFAFVEHMLASMNPETGRLAVVMPHGVLFRGTESGIRQGILEAGLVEAVIGLPPNLFYGTQLAACLLVCRATPAVGREKAVLFLNGSARFEKGRPKNVMSDADVASILDTYQRGEDVDSGVPARLVPLHEISDNDWDLNIGRYVIAEADPEVEASVAVASYIEGRDELRAAEELLDERLAEAGFLA